MVLCNQFSSTALVQALDFLSLLESLFIPQDATLYFRLPIKDSSVKGRGKARNFLFGGAKLWY